MFTRHPQSRTRGVCVGIMAIVLVGLVHAEPIRFDNPVHGDPGHFHWPPAAVGLVYLDMASPAQSQPPAAAGPTVVSQRLLSGNRSRLGGSTSDLYLEVGDGSYLLPLGAGDLIPSGAAYAGVGLIYYSDMSLLPEGVPVYVGVKFPLVAAGDLHYGWIGVERAGAELETFAWGYDTQPGVPILAGIPEPGSLALLALGALLGWRGLRR